MNEWRRAAVVVTAALVLYLGLVLAASTVKLTFGGPVGPIPPSQPVVQLTPTS
jgi:hypothetical protein